MPHQEDDYTGQPVWQSVFFFCCKGMIEGVILLLFLWLLLQVLFTKNLEGELNIACSHMWRVHTARSHTSGATQHTPSSIHEFIHPWIHGLMNYLINEFLRSLLFTNVEPWVWRLVIILDVILSHGSLTVRHSFTPPFTPPKCSFIVNDFEIVNPISSFFYLVFT